MDDRRSHKTDDTEPGGARNQRNQFLFPRDGNRERWIGIERPSGGWGLSATPAAAEAFEERWIEERRSSTGTMQMLDLARIGPCTL
jgi:hypothetical protein